MATIITAGNATNGLKITPDNTGILELKTGTGAGTTALTLNASQNATLAGTLGVGAITSTGVITSSTGALYPIVSGTAQVAVTNFTTSADFTGIPPWAERITVMFNGISLSGTDFILVQIGSGSLSTSGYTSSGSSGTSAVASTTGRTDGFMIRTAAAGDSVTGAMVIQNITSTIWVSNHTCGGSGFFIGGGISPSLSGALDRVSVTRSGTNTFDAGTVNIMWE